MSKPFSVTIKSIESFDDGSGAPAVVVAGPCTWAIDLLGEVKIHNLSGSSTP